MTPQAPPLTAKQEQGVRSREEILDAAERLMGARGYAATSISALSKESGLPASSIYWHFGSKSGVLGAVMARGAARFFAAADAADPGGVATAEHPRDRLAALLHASVGAGHAHPQFLRLFFILLLSAEGDHDQRGVVAQLRAEGERRLRLGLEQAYAPWGDALAARVADELGAVAIALFDGLFIAGQVPQPVGPALIDRAAAALHHIAEGVRATA